MIQNVEKLGTKLQAAALVGRNILERRKIQVRDSGSIQRVSTHVAIGSGCRREERVGIEVLVLAAQNDRASERRIVRWTHWIAVVTVVGRIVAQARCEAQSGF